MNNPEVLVGRTRDPWETFGCSMNRVQSLSLAGEIKSRNLGPTSLAHNIGYLSGTRPSRK